MYYYARMHAAIILHLLASVGVRDYSDGMIARFQPHPETASTLASAPAAPTITGLDRHAYNYKHDRTNTYLLMTPPALGPLRF